MKRDLHKCVYTSSYDRGLEHLLEVWPKVRAAVPDATLEVVYGWQLFDRFYKDNPASMQWKAKILEGLKQPGITEHGRLPQAEIPLLLQRCGLWTYPTHFGEINCISAIKAQAYGCEPVVVDYAALKETVQFGRKVEGDIYDQETKDEYAKQLIAALKEPMSDEKRQEMMTWAREKYSWDAIAKSWEEVLK